MQTKLATAELISYRPLGIEGLRPAGWGFCCVVLSILGSSLFLGEFRFLLPLAVPLSLPIKNVSGHSPKDLGNDHEISREQAISFKGKGQTSRQTEPPWESTWIVSHRSVTWGSWEGKVIWLWLGGRVTPFPVMKKQSAFGPTILPDVKGSWKHGTEIWAAPQKARRTIASVQTSRQESVSFQKLRARKVWADSLKFRCLRAYERGCECMTQSIWVCFCPGLIKLKNPSVRIFAKLGYIY